MLSRINPLLLLSVAIASALLLPALFMDGMFMDGLIYTCVGKNLAIGHGTFWDPYFSATYMTSYHEQPPLLFGLESIFFRVFGTGYTTERFYCLAMFIACMLALRMMWRSLWPTHAWEQKTLWLVLLLFFISPVTFYAYTNNVEEATMVVFALLSAGFIFKGIYSGEFFCQTERSRGQQKKRTHEYIWFVLGGFSLIASSMCKGAQGLFPLVIPIVWWLLVRSISLRKAIIATVILIGIPAAFYFLLSFSDAAQQSYLAYYHDRIYATFTVKQAATTSSRFFILFELLLDLILPIVIGLLVLLAARNTPLKHKREALAFFVIGLSGILPLMVTLEQRGFYLVTGLPFVTTSIALLCANGTMKLNAAMEQRQRLRVALSSVGIVMLIGTITATVYLAGQPKRDAEMLHDVKLIGEKCGTGAIISTDESTWTTWSLQGYLVRYHDISLSKADTNALFFVVPPEINPPPGYKKIDLGTARYHLYSK